VYVSVCVCVYACVCVYSKHLNVGIRRCLELFLLCNAISVYTQSHTITHARTHAYAHTLTHTDTHTHIQDPLPDFRKDPGHPSWEYLWSRV
jgi:hypothetical protein